MGSPLTPGSRRPSGMRQRKYCTARRARPCTRSGSICSTKPSGVPCPTRVPTLEPVPRPVARRTSSFLSRPGNVEQLRDVRPSLHRAQARRPASRQADSSRGAAMVQQPQGGVSVLQPGEGCGSADSSLLRRRPLLRSDSVRLDRTSGAARAPQCAQQRRPRRTGPRNVASLVRVSLPRRQRAARWTVDEARAIPGVARTDGTRTTRPTS